MARPRHRLSEPEIRVDRACDDEVLGLLGACRSARDRFIVIAMFRAGLRRGEVCGLRRADMHFVADASGLGCAVSGPHLHVRRRANANGAWAKSRRSRAVPVDDLVVLAYDTYVFERDRCRQARDCDFVLVNLFHPPLGAPMRPGAVNELLPGLSRDRERIRAATELDDWARAEAMPSDAEITWLRQLIRRVEHDLDALDENDRRQIEEAVRLVRRTRQTVHLGLPTTTLYSTQTWNAQRDNNTHEPSDRRTPQRQQSPPPQSHRCPRPTPHQRRRDHRLRGRPQRRLL